MRLFLFLFAILAIEFTKSCGNRKSASSAPQASAVAAAAPISQIVFLFFEIEKTPNGTEIVKHTGTTKANGLMKKQTVENHPAKNGNILISFLGKDGNVQEERIIEDPLNPIMESYTQSGLEREQMKLNKAEFSVRFNQSGETATIKLEKITSNSKTHLLTLQL